jgi:hypothetical protein
MPAVVSAQSATRHVFVDVTRPSGAAEVDLRVEDFEVTEGGSRREIVSAMMARRPAPQPIGLVLTALTMLGRKDGLLEVMERLATVINAAHTNSAPVYQIEFAGAPGNGKQPPAPQVRVLREGLHLSVISTP